MKTMILSAAKQVLGLNRYQRIRSTLQGPSVQRYTKFGFSRYCPCCTSRLRRFEPFGYVRREEAECPVCGSLERHRLIWLYLSQKTDLFNEEPKKLLHIAPEPQISGLFQQIKNLDYLSGDLDSPVAMMTIDITDIPLENNTFDVIYCSHVLEHVLDDRKAMREFFRVLKPGGWAILQVPITVEATFEDPSVTAPEDRLRLFGQEDHVRRYGPDYAERLREAGFNVTVDDYVRTLSDREIERFGLMRSEDVFVCRKENSGPETLMST